MSITTGGGDKGETSLWSGERVSKDDLRVEAYGTIDELNSHIGEARHYCKSKETKELLLRIQNDLFKVAGQLASKGKLFIEPVTETNVQWLTEKVHHYEKIIKLKGFVIPGTTIQSAKLDICRTVARRAERRIVSLYKTEKIANELLKYMNRLSDFLFILARFEEHLEGKLMYKNDV
ncbi:cob(I)yrinic acid a,c-diamide adenosyltransferase [Kosmotoga sp. DU53]|uniref:cob(I)yrinic acid a,c-diamide adenosyltransferase n=1 Tax=Kosmotoga sp. DU53 TaxID=1310160 RepID=UPI0007C4CF3E|nr:cob(I)yrinic acid a,c-diamide adenosyltransferase [Kosmotoga sp. DU53]MDK2953407.1 cob(I)alamin adenosyltransferase [Kosmotoga sp.]OAA23683.1 ATP--cobalamin adenosyltransferase [Kosmotoga sp. DU53]